MAYKALYRTYRPTTFEEVAGQQHIVKTLKNALETNKLAHAYLFTGPRGTGKTTMAKLLAKALNCGEGFGHQCNLCKNCRAIIDGTHPDVLELDAASNNSVDDIRELIDKVKYGTILGKYKIYIIDEVHMLSTGAFNALLKTLEEPPEHVIFILATTEPHKILPTILSRCQRYDFTKLSDEEIRERLRIVLAEEGIEFNEKAVDLIISLSDGGMRDALSILDQVLRYSSDRLNEEDIMNVFSIESTQEKLSFLKSIINSDVKDVLCRIEKYTLKGSDIKRLTSDLLGILKDILIYQTSANTRLLSFLNSDQVKDISFLLNEETTFKMIQCLLDAQKDYKFVPSISSLFQITVLKMTSLNKKEILSQIKPKIEEKMIETKEQEQIIEKSQESRIIEDNVVEETIIEAPRQEQIDISQDPISIQKEEIVESTPIIANTISDIEPVKSIFVLKDALKGDSFFLEDNTMIDIMVASKKEFKNHLLGKWSCINKLSAHPIYGKYSSTLYDGHVLVASKQVLIIEYPYKKVSERLNKLEAQKDIQTIIYKMFGEQMFVYAVDRNESVRLQQLFMNMKQVGKLPRVEQIELKFEEIK